MTNANAKKDYFRNPAGDIHVCNNCKKPLQSGIGRFGVESTFEYRTMSTHRLLGYGSFCPSCFEELFGHLLPEDLTDIFKKDNDRNEEEKDKWS